MPDERPGNAHITRAKLTDDLVRDLRRRYANGVLISVLARELRMNRNAVSDAIHGRSWRHVR